MEKHKTEVRSENKAVQPSKKVMRRTTNPHRLNAPRPINEEEKLDTIEFKEVQVKPVDINIMELRRGQKKSVV